MINISIEGMLCEHCINRVEEALKEVKNVESITVNLLTKSAQVTGEKIDEKELIEAIEEAGYKAEIK